MGAHEPTGPDAASLRQTAFWQALAPALHVQDTAFIASHAPMAPDAGVLQALHAAIREEGYFQLPPQSWGLPIDAMAGAIRTLDAQALPLPFAFVYDEFWLLYWRLNGLLEGLLGPGYLRLPDFWAWLVDPQRGQSGWAPHRDKGWISLFPDRSPKSLTIWIPLADATPLNGCMYVVPADRDPVYGTPRDAEAAHRPADVRALPAAAGSVLCWTQALLHWGASTSRRETRPRISVAFEFQRGDVPAFNQPLTSPREIPGMALRLALIGKQILQYQHMYPLAPAMEALARELVTPPAA